jgi:hypothetical protein
MRVSSLSQFLSESDKSCRSPHGNSIYFLQFSKTVLLLVSGTIWQGISVQHFTVAKQAE